MCPAHSSAAPSSSWLSADPSVLADVAVAVAVLPEAPALDGPEGVAGLAVVRDGVVEVTAQERDLAAPGARATGRRAGRPATASTVPARRSQSPTERQKSCDVVPDLRAPRARGLAVTAFRRLDGVPHQPLVARRRMPRCRRAGPPAPSGSPWADRRRYLPPLRGTRRTPPARRRSGSARRSGRPADTRCGPGRVARGDEAGVGHVGARAVLLRSRRRPSRPRCRGRRTT